MYYEQPSLTWSLAYSTCSTAIDHYLHLLANYITATEYTLQKEYSCKNKSNFIFTSFKLASRNYDVLYMKSLFRQCGIHYSANEF